MRENPAKEWEDLSRERMGRLRGENEALLRRLRELEESGASTAGSASKKDGGGEELVPRESYDVLSSEKDALEELVRQKEKRLLRLQQVFTAKSAEFREAIASILGLKLAFYPNGQVRVTSVYDLGASFIFQPLPSSSSSALPGGASTGAGVGGPGGGPPGMKMQLVAQGEGGPQDLSQLMRNWIEVEQCIPGFLAMVTLECYENSKMGARGMGEVDE